MTATEMAGVVRVRGILNGGAGLCGRRARSPSNLTCTEKSSLSAVASSERSVLARGWATHRPHACLATLRPIPALDPQEHLGIMDELIRSFGPEDSTKVMAIQQAYEDVVATVANKEQSGAERPPAPAALV